MSWLNKCCIRKELRKLLHAHNYKYKKKSNVVQPSIASRHNLTFEKYNCRTIANNNTTNTNWNRMRLFIWIQNTKLFCVFVLSLLGFFNETKSTPRISKFCFCVCVCLALNCGRYIDCILKWVWQNLIHLLWHSFVVC